MHVPTHLQLADQEFEYRQREKEISKQHEWEVTGLKQELFSQSMKVVRSTSYIHSVDLMLLRFQLKDLEVAQNSRKLLASGKSPDQVISQEDKLALQSEIKEQEVLLQGYQKVTLHVCFHVVRYCKYVTALFLPIGFSVLIMGMQETAIISI